MAPVRIKRDRVPFTCSNCTSRVWSRPDNRLICGQCFIPLEPQLPAHYPQALESPRPNLMKVGLKEIPLEEFALAPHIRDLLNQIRDDADQAVVVRNPEPQKPETPQKPKRKGALPEDVLAEADREIRAYLKADAETGVKRSGWKVQLAKKLDRDPSWVTHRIKKVQAERQAVAA